MGSDSCVSGKHETIIGRPKAIKKGEFLIGGAGTLRDIQILFYSTNVPNRLQVKGREGEDHYHYLVNTFGSCYRKALKDQGRLRLKDSKESNSGQYILAYRGNIYQMGVVFEIDEFPEGYGAIGSGDSYAMGSLHATANSDLTAEERIKLALDAASKYSGFVSPPYEILCMEWKGFEHGDEYIFYDSDGSIKNGYLEDDIVEE